MTTTKKMVLIPPDTLTALREDVDRVAPSSSVLDDAMTSVLKSDMDIDAKLREYQQTLRQFLFRRNRALTEPKTLDLVEKANIDPVAQSLQDLLSQLPKSTAPKARSLVEHILRKPGGIQWAANGDIEINGVRLLDQNIVDAVKTLSSNKQTELTDGVRRLAEALKKSGIPSTAIANQKLWKNIFNPPVEPIKKPASPSYKSDYTDYPVRKRQKRSINKWTPYHLD